MRYGCWEYGQLGTQLNVVTLVWVVAEAVAGHEVGESQVGRDRRVAGHDRWELWR